jgi:hypothetical protein
VGLEVTVYGLGFEGSGFRISGIGCWVSSFGFRV